GGGWGGVWGGGGGAGGVGRFVTRRDLPPPRLFVDGVLVRAALPVDEFADDVGVTGVLGCFSNHPDEQDAQGGIPPVLGPVRDRPGCLQVERCDDAIGVGAGTPGQTGDVLAWLLGPGPHVRALPDPAVLDP